MEFAKKVIVPVNFTDELVQLIRPMKDLNFLNHSEVYFVHVVKIVTYPVYFGDCPLIEVLEADRKSMEESALTWLLNITRDNLPEDFDGKIHHKVISDENPKRKFTEFVAEEKADLVVIPARSKHGIFDSSFAQYVNKHTHCNVLVLRNNSEPRSKQ